MQDDTGLTPLEKEIGAALGGLRPARAAMNRDRLMFNAGRVSSRRRSRLWQGISVCLGLLLLASALYRPAMTGVQTSTGVVANDMQQRPPSDLANQRRDSTYREQADSAIEYVRMRRAVLTEGIDALPAPSPVPATYDKPLMKEHLSRTRSST